ncbi:MAG: SUMF1/EgtB/PvdO family nonheme iron enzyme [Haliscomenobacter sp.]|uniref:SUMF1/EgtB/PvdO family nonheme iron enzyme n=1 Tax=Haliscomenobacter sp. TaxID=2717303 RepID=UPI0029A191C0|nr:SUMF1/EgtB/PvdO family nonheme iron enzyme [Haliscomenobacter sp.]MDX2072556.1 SUMF1/EgtB/PvdO family nonheme iron enzyme [Haliscomenobacter sp.]
MPDRDLVRKDRQSSPASSPRGTNYLLAIAIDEYLHCSKLNNAVRDAEAFIELLTTRYHFDPTHVTFIKDAEATEKRIRRAFDRLIDVVTEQDNFIVYFSGHGRHHERRGGYWIPVEAGTSDDDWSDYISNDTIKSYLSKIKSFHTFLIADSCFSGSLFIDKSKEKFSGDRRDTEPSRWGLTSGKKEIVSDGRPGHHSPFAAALLDVLSKADQPPGVMRICDLVLEKVAANAQQTPMGSPLQVPGHQGGQMVLYFREDEAQAWAAAQATNTIKAYSDFYDQFPNSKHRREALDKIEELEENEAWHKVPKNRLAALLRFMEDNPHSPHFQEAQQLVNALREAAVKSPSAAASTVPQSIVPPLIITPKFKVPEHMVLVKGGTFQMGEDKETHQVTLSDFLIAKHQLTFEEYGSFCKATGRELPMDLGWGRGKRPVINVNWFDAVDYCNWRSQQEGLHKVYQIKQQKVIANWQANGYRLPTEAEWEYAAQGGQQSKGFEYAGSNNVDEVAWYSKNSGNKTQPVGQKQANELGLYDLSGNVCEWCWDWYGNYRNIARKDPHGPDTGPDRVHRGGSWFDSALSVRVAFRLNYDPGKRIINIGFRLARAAVAS